MKLYSLKNSRWHLFLSGPTLRSPSKFDGVAEGKKLQKRIHMDQWTMDVRKRDPFYEPERDYLTLDLWWDALDTDDIVFSLIKILRKHYGIESFQAELDQTAKDDSWEFPTAFYRCHDSNLVVVTTVSAEEVRRCTGFLPREAWYAVGCGILACRSEDIQPGVKFCYQLP